MEGGLGRCGGGWGGWVWGLDGVGATSGWSVRGCFDRGSTNGRGRGVGPAGRPVGRVGADRPYRRTVVGGFRGNDERLGVWGCFDRLSTNGRGVSTTGGRGASARPWVPATSGNDEWGALGVRAARAVVGVRGASTGSARTPWVPAFAGTTRGGSARPFDEAQGERGRRWGWVDLWACGGA